MNGHPLVGTDSVSLDITLVPRYIGPNVTRKDRVMDTAAEAAQVERVQLGVRMEKSMVKVLKGLAEFQGVTLGQLLEKIVLHSFEPVPGEEGEQSWSPHGKAALAAIVDLKRIYGMDYGMHDLRAELATESKHQESTAGD